MTDGMGNAVYDRQAVSDVVADFYDELYGSKLEASNLPAWIYGRYGREALDGFPQINGIMVRTLITKMADGKTCAEDHIVAEMLKSLPEETADTLAELFVLRLLNHVSEDAEEAWDIYMVPLIAKVPGANQVSQFRPIAVLPVLQKLFSMFVSHICNLRSVPLSQYQFAFRPHYQCHEVVATLRWLVERAIEFQPHLFIFDGDVRKAYDHVLHDKWAKTLRKKGIPKIGVASFVREVRRGQAKMKIPGCPETRPVRRWRSLVQGDPEAPAHFNIYIDECITKFDEECSKAGWGYPLDSTGNPKRMGILVFADNFWILAQSPKMLQQMTERWLQILERDGLGVCLEECTWATTAEDQGDWKIRLKDTLINRASRDIGFKVLGTWLTLNNNASVEVDFRIAKAWKAFHKHRKVLCCRRANIKQRFALLNKVVKPVITYCCGSLTLTLAHERKIRDTQQKMMSQIMGRVKKPGSDWTLEDIMWKRGHRLKLIRESQHIQTWDVSFRVSAYRWAGHVARMQKYETDKVVFKTLTSKDITYIRGLEHAYNQQCHGKRFKVWRWERQFYKPLGDNWKSLTLSKDDWEDGMSAWLDARCRLR